MRRVPGRVALLAGRGRPSSSAPAPAPTSGPAAATAPELGAEAAKAAVPAQPIGKSDWFYAGWATLFSVVLGGPAFFLYELQNNVETRLWAEEQHPELLDQIRAFMNVMGDQEPPEERLAGEAIPVLGMLPGASGDEDCFEDERWGAKSEALLEAGLGAAAGTAERGDEEVTIRVALSNGVHVLVRGRASDTDSDVIHAAVFEGGGVAGGAEVDWMLPESEVQAAPAAEFLHPATVAQPSRAQLDGLEESVRAQRARLEALRGADEASLPPIDRARLPQRLAEAEAAVEGGERAIAGLRRALASMQA